MVAWYCEMVCEGESEDEGKWCELDKTFETIKVIIGKNELLDNNLG